MGMGQGIDWKFVQAWEQFYDGLTKSWFEALKHTLEHMLQVYLDETLPTLNYAELWRLLLKAVKVFNDEQIVERNNNKDENNKSNIVRGDCNPDITANMDSKVEIGHGSLGGSESVEGFESFANIGN